MLSVSKKIYNFIIKLKNKMTRKKQPKKDPAYMLFLFGDFDEQKNLTTELSAQLLDYVTSPFLKFTYGEYGVVFHFRSDEIFVILKDYIDMVLNDITDQYFLMEVAKNTEVKMPKKIKKDFLNIDGDDKKIEPKGGAINVEDFKEKRKKDMKNITFDIFLPIFDPNSDYVVEGTYEIKEPTVDEILEKITEKGIESLTEKEREILDNYGKRKDGGH